MFKKQKVFSTGPGFVPRCRRIYTIPSEKTTGPKQKIGKALVLIVCFADISGDTSPFQYGGFHSTKTPRVATTLSASPLVNGASANEGTYFVRCKCPRIRPSLSTPSRINV